MEVLENVFWQTIVNDQRPKLNLQVNDIKIGLVDTGADITIISPKSWDSKWPLQMFIPILGVGKLSQIKESVH